MLFYISNLNSSCIFNKEYVFVWTTECAKEANKKIIIIIKRRWYDHLHYPLKWEKKRMSEWRQKSRINQANAACEESAQNEKRKKIYNTWKIYNIEQIK